MLMGCEPRRICCCCMGKVVGGPGRLTKIGDEFLANALGLAIWGE